MNRRTCTAIALALALVAPAAAQILDPPDPALCDPNETEIPPWSAGRDEDGCLLVDEGDGTLALFQQEWRHLAGTNECTGLPTEIAPEMNGEDENGNGCNQYSPGNYCTYLYYDVTLDNYVGQGCRGEDGLTLAGKMRAWRILFKDSQILNTWKCAAPTTTWNGPNGMTCPAGEPKDTSHTDGLQFRHLPYGDGSWAVFQDSELVNGQQLAMLVQAESSTGAGLGSIMFQGGRLDRQQAVGLASAWIDDCKARGVGDYICETGNAEITNDIDELWFVSFDGVTPIDAKGNFQRLVVVDPEGFNGGWPDPLSAYAVPGPGVCPNGPIADHRNTAPGQTYCYETLERAVDDGLVLPPFAQLSESGWGCERADFNGDGSVDFTDYGIFGSFYGPCSDDYGYDPMCSVIDLSEDGQVGFPDFAVFGRLYGVCGG